MLAEGSSGERQADQGVEERSCEGVVPRWKQVRLRREGGMVRLKL